MSLLCSSGSIMEGSLLCSQSLVVMSLALPLYCIYSIGRLSLDQIQTPLQLFNLFIGMSKFRLKACLNDLGLRLGKHFCRLLSLSNTLFGDIPHSEKNNDRSSRPNYQV